MICRGSDNESCESNDTEDLDVDFEQPVNQAEEEENEDWGFPPDLRRIMEREEREIKPHQEETRLLTWAPVKRKKKSRSKLVCLLTSKMS